MKYFYQYLRNKQWLVKIADGENLFSRRFYTYLGERRIPFFHAYIEGTLTTYVHE